MSLDETYLDEIPPLKLLWYERKHLVEEALKKGYDTHTIDEVEERLEAGYAQLFVSDNSAMVVELPRINGELAAHIWLAGGDMEELLELEEHMTEWSKQQGCKYVTINGRLGWERVLRDRGYNRIKVTLKKDL